MQFVGFWEYDPKDMEEISEIMGKCESGLEFIFGPVSIGGQHRGFTIFETEDIDKITKYVAHYAPLVDFTVYPLVRVSEFFEKYMRKHGE
jgi:hypothetical protein